MIYFSFSKEYKRKLGIFNFKLKINLNFSNENKRKLR